MLFLGGAYAHIRTPHTTQAVDHPYLVVHSNTTPHSTTAGTKAQQHALAEEQGACPICHDPVEDPVVSSCQHAFCRVCVTEYLDNQIAGTCVVWGLGFGWGGVGDDDGVLLWNDVCMMVCTYDGVYT